MKIRAPRFFDVDDSSVMSGLEFDPEEDRAQQQFRDDADINVIVERAGVTGFVPVNEDGMYGDFSEIVDFQTGMQQLKAAEHSFLQLPAKIREQFDHNGMRFADWISDPDNAEEAQRMGLLPRMSDDSRGVDLPPPVEADDSLESDSE